MIKVTLSLWGTFQVVTKVDSWTVIEEQYLYITPKTRKFYGKEMLMDLLFNSLVTIWIDVDEFIDIKGRVVITGRHSQISAYGISPLTRTWLCYAWFCCGYMIDIIFLQKECPQLSNEGILNLQVFTSKKSRMFNLQLIIIKPLKRLTFPLNCKLYWNKAKWACYIFFCIIF